MAYQGASSSFISPPPLNLRFWNDCKLPDYEEVVGHPPTPPPPYSENPTESPQVNSPPVHRTVEAPEAEAQAGTEASASPLEEGAVSGPVQAQSLSEVCDEDREEDEELSTRRRHITGDSGIEVCVCQVDVDESSGGFEDTDEEQRMCKATGGDFCSARQQQPFIAKGLPADLPGQSVNTSSDDHMV